MKENNIFVTTVGKQPQKCYRHQDPGGRCNISSVKEVHLETLISPSLQQLSDSRATATL